MRASKECCHAEGIVRLTNDFCSKHCLDTLFPRIRLMTPLFKLNYSNAQGGLALTGHLGVLLASSWGLSIAWNTAWLLPMLIVQGVVWVSFFACLHETVHRTAFQSRKWNDRIATLCGFALLIPATHFRRFHNAHHRHPQISGKDPELSAPKPQTLAQYVCWVSALPFWKDRLLELSRHAQGDIRDDFVPEQEHRQVVREARIALGLLGGSLVWGMLGWSGLLCYWLLPLLFGQPFLRLFLLAEHTGCEESTNPEANTRTTLSNRWVRWLMWNMPYHAEHHVCPQVPFHQLPQLHGQLKSRWQVVASGYRAFHRDLVSDFNSGSSHPVRSVG